MNLAKFPRHKLTFGPTPIEKLDRLSKHLGGKVEIFAKRDDCNSGLAFGGNKVRKMEYLVPDALAQGCDTLVTIGGIQSNHTRQVAAIAAKLGLKCRLVQENWVDYHDAVYDRVGNILMSRLMGAHVELVDEGFGINFKRELGEGARGGAARGRQALCDSRRRLRSQARRARLCRLRRGGEGAGGGARLQVRLHLRLLGHRLDAGRHGGRLRRRRPRRSASSASTRRPSRRRPSTQILRIAERTADLVELGRADHARRRRARHALRRPVLRHSLGRDERGDPARARGSKA